MLAYTASGRQKFCHSVKLKIDPCKWVNSKQRLKVKDKNDEYFNAHLDNLESIIKDAQIQSLFIHKEVDFSFVKQRFNDVLFKKYPFKSAKKDFNVSHKILTQ